MNTAGRESRLGLMDREGSGLGYGAHGARFPGKLVLPVNKTFSDSTDGNMKNWKHGNCGSWKLGEWAGLDGILRRGALEMRSICTSLSWGTVMGSGGWKMQRLQSLPVGEEPQASED